MTFTKHEGAVNIALLDYNSHDASRNSSTKSPDVQHDRSLREKLNGFPGRTFLIVSLLPLALSPIVILSAIAEMASQNYIRGRSCYPNGLWKEATGATWRIMDSTYFFTPNLSFGAVTFTQVKVIDIAWDLIVGRGGQMGLAWVNWRVFNEWLVYHLERYATSYKMYSVVALQTTSWASLGVFAKEFLCFGEKNWGRFFRWLAMFCMFISTLYVLAFPTLMAAMTGYITTYEPYVEDYEHNLIEWEKVDEIVMSISGGDGIGFEQSDVWITAQEEQLIYDLDRFINDHSTVNNNTSIRSRRMGDEGYQTNGGGEGPEVLIVGVRNGTNIEWENVTYTIPYPGLSVRRYLSTGRPLRDVVAPNEQFYTVSGRYGDQYNSSYIKSHSSCKPSETYQWGFSYIFLFMVSIFNFLWSVIMVCMWLDTRRASRMYKSGRRPGLLRSVLDLSAAVREELGPEAEILEEEELREKLVGSGGALCVPKEELRVRRTDTGELGTRKRMWTSKLTGGSTF